MWASLCLVSRRAVVSPWIFCRPDSLWDPEETSLVPHSLLRLKSGELLSLNLGGCLFPPPLPSRSTAGCLRV